MYQSLLFSHSILRWFVLASLFYSLYKAYKGYSSKLPFTETDNAVRHWTATIAHIQLIFGILIYVQSPIVKYFWKNFKAGIENVEIAFFGILHILLMLSAIVLITIGSALAKRKRNDSDKFKTMLFWFSLALIIIFIAIPWPFSPFANRPYFR
jgi:drug/metabolite transporter (DMT)-like permease